MSKHQTIIQKWLIGKWNLGRLMRFLLLIYAAIGIYGYFFSEGLIFQPQPSSYQDSQNILKLPTVDREQISALYLPQPTATYTILYSHGNAEDLGDVRFILEQLQTAGFAVFAYDYRGYGTSQGKPSEQNAYEDIEAAYTYLTQTVKVPPERIIVYGRSVGGGPSIYLASRQAVAGLVLESAFTSVFRVITRIPLYPFDKFPNIGRIKAVRCPVLVMHGTADQVIPFWHGQALFQQANEPKRFVPIKGANHNDLIRVAGVQHTQELQRFVQLLRRGSKSS